MTQNNPRNGVAGPLNEPSTHFVRNSSGLVLGLSAWNVFVFNVLGYATGLSLATNPTFLGGLYPNANIYWTLAFGFILSIFSGWTYGMFAGMYPRNGGDYIYISRSLSPWLGFVANWGFTWSQIYGLGVFSGWAVRDSLSPAFLTSGYLLHSPTMISIGQSLASKWSIFAGGVIVIVACLVASLLAQRILKAALTVLFLLAMLSAVIMVVSFIGVDPQEFKTRFDAFMSESVRVPDAYNSILHLAQGQNLQTGQPDNIWQSLRAIPVGFLVFFGFTYSVYLGGEVREPMKSQSRGILGALAVAVIFSFVGMGCYFHAVGRDFNSAVAMVRSMPECQLPAGGSMVFFSGVMLKSPWLAVIMTFGSFLWFFLLPLVMIQLSVRNVFAWAFDRIIPDWFATVGGGNRAWPATCAVALAAVPLLAADALLGFPYVNYTLLFSVCFCVTGIAGLVVPYRKKTRSDFSLAPPLVQLRIGRVYLFTVASGISAVMFAFLVWSALTSTALSGVAAGAIPVLVLIIVYGLGGLIWWIRRRSRPGAKRPPLDPDALYKNLPPA